MLSTINLSSAQQADTEKLLHALITSRLITGTLSSLAINRHPNRLQVIQNAAAVLDWDQKESMLRYKKLGPKCWTQGGGDRVKAKEFIG